MAAYSCWLPPLIGALTQSSCLRYGCQPLPSTCGHWDESGDPTAFVPEKAGECEAGWSAFEDQLVLDKCFQPHDVAGLSADNNGSDAPSLHMNQPLMSFWIA